MKPTGLDLAPRNAWFWLMRWRAWQWGVMLATLPVLVAGALALAEVRQERLAADEDLARLQRRVERLQQRTPALRVRLTPAQAQAAERAVRQLNLPWMDLLDGLEASVTPEVALLGLDFDAGAQRLRGSAEARHPRAMLAFAARLKAQGAFTEVTLSGHQVNEADRNKPVQFEFLARWTQEAR